MSTSIDPWLTNAPRSFQCICGLPDFHLMTLTVMRKNLKKLKPRTVKDYLFTVKDFKNCLLIFFS